MKRTWIAESFVRFRVRIPVVLLCIGGVTSANTATAQQQLNPSKYRVVKAPEFESGWSGSARGFNWVDNERLLFVVNDKALSTTERREGRQVVTKGVGTINLWNLPDGKIRRYRSEPLTNR